MKSETRQCQNCKNDFTIEPDDFGFYEKMEVPPPEICVLCRQQLRTSFRNFKTLYKRPSSLSGKNIVSMYNLEAKCPVYHSEEWWSDDWDPMDYGRDFDFTRPFFEQWKELFEAVPHPALIHTNSVNCEYANLTFDARNCYFSFGVLDDEDCDYSHIIWNSRDCTDGLYLFKCETCYECIDCTLSAKMFYSQECENCVDSIGLFDCRNCINSIGCVGLVNKSYYIFNKQVTKEEYKEFLERHPLSDKASIDYILQERDKLRTQVPQRSFFGSHNANVSGNHIQNARNVFYSFDVKGGEDSKYGFTIRKTTDTYDASFAIAMSECYNSLTCEGNKIMCSQLIVDSHDILYSELCYGSNDLFGCIGLRKKSYCILNKQYSKDEYVALKEKIIEHMRQMGEWGKFLPKELSPFAYNESIANEYMPLSKEEALAHGFRWRDDIPMTTGQGTIEYSELPKYPEDFNDDLLKEILTCESCNKNYKLVGREINFYKKNKLSIPAKCFHCRHAGRMSKRNPRELWSGTCSRCGNKILTSYTPEDQKKFHIYCEKCYQQEVY